MWMHPWQFNTSTEKSSWKKICHASIQNFNPSDHMYSSLTVYLRKEMHLPLIACTSAVMLFLQASVTAQQTSAQPTGHDATPPGDCGSQMYDSVRSSKDVFDIKDRAEEALNFAQARLQKQVDSIHFDTDAVEKWVKSLPVDKLPNFPFVDEEKTIENMADLVVRLIEKAEKLLKEVATKELDDSKKELKEAFDAVVAGFLPQGLFEADTAWLEDCCGSSGYWTTPRANISGNTAVRASASFKLKVDIGGSVGVEAGTKCEINFTLKLSLSLSKWTDARFWPPPKDKNDDSNHRGCSVTVKARPNWKATYDAEQGAGVMLIVSLGRGKDLENEPPLKEVDAILKITDSKK